MLPRISAPGHEAQSVQRGRPRSRGCIADSTGWIRNLLRSFGCSQRRRSRRNRRWRGNARHKPVANWL